jgi:hypothetical protein
MDHRAQIAAVLTHVAAVVYALVLADTVADRATHLPRKDHHR